MTLLLSKNRCRKRSRSRRSVMKIDGGCHCGYIAYEAEADPAEARICHCTDCQTLSGSAFRTVFPTREGSFKLRSSELKIYVKTGESGTARPQSFCPNCGTPIYSATVGKDPKVYVLRLGTVRQRGQFTPNCNCGLVRHSIGSTISARYGGSKSSPLSPQAALLATNLECLLMAQSGHS